MAWRVRAARGENKGRAPEDGRITDDHWPETYKNNLLRTRNEIL